MESINGSTEPGSTHGEFDCEPKRIPLSRGLFAVVDAHDFKAISGFKWCATVSGGKTYAHRRAKTIDGRRSLVSMHRVIMGVQDGPSSVHVDHINGDTLDNRRCNLRLCKPGENSRNLKAARAATGLRGVSKTRGGKWRVRIRLDHELIEVGTFDTERDASVAYCFASKCLHGEFGSTPGHVLPAMQGGHAVRSPLDTVEM